MPTNYNGPHEAAHTFLIRPRDGFTKQLQRKLLAAPSSKPLDLTVLLEGPYGQTFTLARHSDILMIVGGSGITAAISRAYALLENGGARCPKLHLVWAAQQRAFVEDVCSHELKRHIDGERARVDVFLTRDLDEEKMMEDRLDVGVHCGRPDLEKLIETARMQSARSLGVFCCGPLRMGADCRRAVARLLAEKGKDIGFYEERFGWEVIMTHERKGTKVEG